MNQDKILKIIKGLNRFSLDDIEVMTGLEENKTEKILTEFIRQEKITGVGNEYRYVNKNISHEFSLKLREKPVISMVKNDKIAFLEAAEYFLINHAFKNCSPTTFKTYKSLIKHHLNPFFGKMTVKNISRKDIKQFIETKYMQEIPDRRLNKCISLFGFMFKKFMEWEFISENPYSGIENVKFAKNNKVQILNETQVNVLLKFALTDFPDFYLPILLILSTGIKKSELLALKKEDFDLEKLKINVDKTIFEGKILTHKFKTASRQVDIPELIVPALDEILKNKSGSDFVFYDTSLSWFTQDRKMRVEFSKLVKQVKLPKITFNDLRHTYAYRALQNGMFIDYLHKQLGDYSIQATMDKYRDFIS